MKELFRYSHNRINDTSLDFPWYLMWKINRNQWPISITDPRDTGKTTLMLQNLMKNP
jgi:predicted AAA+ superfamily ATPase